MMKKKLLKKVMSIVIILTVCILSALLVNIVSWWRVPNIFLCVTLGIIFSNIIR